MDPTILVERLLPCVPVSEFHKGFKLWFLTVSDAFKMLKSNIFGTSSREP